MKNLAIVEAGIVTNIILCEDNFEIENSIQYEELNPAQIGGIYENGYFYPPQPYCSWTANKGKWICPVEKPNDSQDYLWNEADQSWDLIND